MAMTGTHAFDSAVQTANQWLHELMDELHMQDSQDAYHALRAVLHTLRDRLPVNEAAHLSAQLPMLVRGVFYEGYHPADKPIKYKRQGFFEDVQKRFQRRDTESPERLVRAVFKLLSTHISPGEIKDVRVALPNDLQELWD